jgi:hypothetical protein
MMKFLYLFFAITMHVSQKASDLEVSKTHVALTTEEDEHLLRCCARVKKCWFFGPVKNAIMKLPETDILSAIRNAVEHTNSNEEMINSLMPIDHTELLISAIQSYGIPWKAAAITGGLAVLAIGTSATIAALVTSKSNNREESFTQDSADIDYADSLVEINTDFFPSFDVAVPIDDGYVISFIEYESNRQGEIRRAGQLKNKDISALSPDQLAFLSQVQETYHHAIESTGVINFGANVSIPINASKSSSTSRLLTIALTHSPISPTKSLTVSSAPSNSSTKSLSVSPAPSSSPTKSLSVSPAPSRSRTGTATLPTHTAAHTRSLTATSTQSKTRPDFSLYDDFSCLDIAGVEFLSECIENRCFRKNASIFDNSTLLPFGLELRVDTPISIANNSACYFATQGIKNIFEFCTDGYIPECDCIGTKLPNAPTTYPDSCYPFEKIRDLTSSDWCYSNSDCSSQQCHFPSGACFCASDLECISFPYERCMKSPYPGNPKLCLLRTNSLSYNSSSYRYFCPSGEYDFESEICSCNPAAQTPCVYPDKCIQSADYTGTPYLCLTSYVE